jgi:hypothetical protein
MIGGRDMTSRVSVTELLRNFSDILGGVRLELDVQRRDRYGRSLGYLWLTDGSWKRAAPYSSQE